MSEDVDAEKSGSKGEKGCADYAAHGNFESLIHHRIQSSALRAVAQRWHEVRGAKRMPSWTDILATDLSPYLNVLWAYKYDPKTTDFRFELAGNRLRKWGDTTFIGQRFPDLTSLSNFEEARQHMITIVTTPLAFRSSGRLFRVRNYDVTGERIALPLAEDGKTGDGIFGASEYWPPPLLGLLELVHENVEWYEI
jgi:hypothetical protein